MVAINGHALAPGRTGLTLGRCLTLVAYTAVVAAAAASLTAWAVTCEPAATAAVLSGSLGAPTVVTVPPPVVAASGVTSTGQAPAVQRGRGAAAGSAASSGGGGAKGEWGEDRQALEALMRFDTDEQRARADDFNATKAAAATRDAGCVPPVVCHAGKCAAAEVPAGAGSCLQYGLPPMDTAVASGAKSVVLEVGPNARPESTKLAKRDGRLVIAVEPLQGEGMVVWARAFADVVVSAAAGSKRSEAQLSIDRTMSALLEGNFTRRRRTQRAAVLPAADIIEAYVPAAATAQFFVIDAQGFDLEVALSAGTAGLKRFTYIIFECQELFPEHPYRINAGSPTCLQSVAAIATTTGHRLAGCVRNAALFEFNCLMVNPALESVAAQLPDSTVIGNSNATTTPPEADWRVAANVATSTGLEQLTALLGKADGTDAYELMCPISYAPERASAKCKVQSAEELRRQLRHACTFWDGECSRLRNPPKIMRCFRASARRCTEGLAGRCQNRVLACGSASNHRCIAKAMQPCAS